MEATDSHSSPVNCQPQNCSPSMTNAVKIEDGEKTHQATESPQQLQSNTSECAANCSKLNNSGEVTKNGDISKTCTDSKKTSSALSSRNHLLRNGHRIPSYVGISCAISGYANFSRYCNTNATRAITVVKDGKWFLGELNKTISTIQNRVEATELLLVEQSSFMSEDVSGKLRAAIGKANLLKTQKLNQFRELCMKNINQRSDEQFPTTDEDLAGFWDMVLIQIDDIKETFDEIDKMKENGWKCSEPTPLPTQNLTPMKSRVKKTPSPKDSPLKTARDTERRNRLKEAKLKQAQIMASNVDDDVVTIFAPNK